MTRFAKTMLASTRLANSILASDVEIKDHLERCDLCDNPIFVGINFERWFVCSSCGLNYTIDDLRIELQHEEELSNSTRNGNGGDTGRYLIPIVILVISVSGYWWDCYINDLQDRVDARVADIKETLILLPSLDRTQASKAITKIGAHKDLSRSDWCKKVCLLKNWRFEHFLFWVPLLALSFYLFFKSKFG